MSTTGSHTTQQRRPGPSNGKPAAAAQPKQKPSAAAKATGDNGKRSPRFRASERVSSHHDEMVATSLARNALSRERYEFQLRIVYVLLGLLGVSMVANVYFGLRQPEYVYYALSSEGKLTPVTPLENPIQSKEQVLAWTAESLSVAFSLSFGNYQQQLSDSRYLFTSSGWEGFQQALARNGMLDAIISQKLVASAVPAGAPVINSSGVVADGRYGWRVEMPLIVTYQSASGANSSTFVLEAIVQRVPESENPRGLAIGQIIAR